MRNLHTGGNQDMGEGEQNTAAPPPTRWGGRRGASPAAAAVILIVVIVVVGAGGYFGLNAATPGSTAGHTTSSTVSTCVPKTAPVCKGQGNVSANDVVMTVPYQAGYGQTFGSVAQNSSVPASLSVSQGETVNKWSVNWGNGVVVNSSSPIIAYTYQTLGMYAISGNALVGTTVHTGTGYLFPLEVTPSITTNTAGTFPSVAATFANSSAGGINPWVRGSGTVSVGATYTAAPSDTAWIPLTTSIVVSGAGTVTPTSTYTANGAAATVNLPSPGVYQITFVGPIQNVLSKAVIYQNYTWGVFVSPSNLGPACGSCSSSGAVKNIKSPHPGTIDSYEVVPGGATSIDPAVDYESVGYEVIANVYQTLVYYNGSSSSSFVPELATCVPGTAQCQSLYGSSLITPFPGTNNPEYWTFVIDKNANFYDPSTGASWGVYPTDVMASLARTAAFADLPFVASAPGWIQSQSWVQYLNTNGSWDHGYHSPFNNTPQGILSGMLINDTQYCPTVAMSSEHGCITFNANGGGTDWPFFLELMADPDGAGIGSCGWMGYMGAGAPGFTTTAPHGDGPCLLPDGGTSTNNSAWTNYLATLSPTSWDTFELNAVNAPAVFPQVRFAAVGSGPYYVASISTGVGYVLQANPAFGQPNCAGEYWCQPAAGNYVHTVNVYWEPTDQVGIQEYLQGKADFAGILTTDTPTLLNLQQAGKIGILNTPTISVFFDPINMGVNMSKISQYYSGSVHLPSSSGTFNNFFSYVGLRQFMVNAFNYTQDLAQVLTVSGVQFGINYGGAIPHYMGNYYANNVTWPAGSPNSNPNAVGGAAWWWAQANNASSPYYDALLSQCTTTNPCTFPVAGELPAGNIQDLAYPIWEQYVKQISGGRISFTEVDLTFTQLVQYAEESGPGQNPLAVYTLGWLPDYPDPTDYTVPMYSPNATYTSPGAVYQALSQDMASSCPTAGQVDGFAALAFWTNQQGVPQQCQGFAYDVLTWADSQAGAMPVGPERTLYYNMASHIANDLALYLYQFQQQGVGSYAPWINPNSINTNVVLGGDGLFAQLQGNGLI